jgi:hypothetical protein
MGIRNFITTRRAFVREHGGPVVIGAAVITGLLLVGGALTAAAYFVAVVAAFGLLATLIGER